MRRYGIQLPVCGLHPVRNQLSRDPTRTSANQQNVMIYVPLIRLRHMALYEFVFGD